MAAVRLFLAGLTMGLGPRLRLLRGTSHGSAPAARRGDPLPPILAFEGDPDRTIRTVIDQTAARLGATACGFERLSALSRDPDLASVVGVVLTRPRGPQELMAAVEDARARLAGRPVVMLAPQPLSPGLQDILPLDASFIAPPLTVDRLLFALHLAPGAHA